MLVLRFTAVVSFLLVVLLNLAGCDSKGTSSPPIGATKISPVTPSENFTAKHPMDHVFTPGQTVQITKNLELSYEEWPLAARYVYFFPRIDGAAGECNIQTKPFPNNPALPRQVTVAAGTEFTINEASSDRSDYRGTRFSSAEIVFNKTGDLEFAVLCILNNPTNARSVTYSDATSMTDGAIVMHNEPTISVAPTPEASLFFLDWFKSPVVVKAGIELEKSGRSWKVAFQKGVSFLDPDMRKVDLKEPHCILYFEEAPGAGNPKILSLKSDVELHAQSIKIKRNKAEHGLTGDRIFVDLTLDAGWSMGCYYSRPNYSETHSHELKPSETRKILGAGVVLPRRVRR